MAVYKLDSTDYRYLDFDEDLWKGESRSISDIVSDLYPPVLSLTSKSENQDFSWLYGRVGIEGKGKVSVTYPYFEEHTEAFNLRNVSFSTFPFVTLEASPENFRGWYDCQGNLLEDNVQFVIEEDSYTNLTGFIAKFE